MCVSASVRDDINWKKCVCIHVRIFSCMIFFCEIHKTHDSLGLHLPRIQLNQLGNTHHLHRRIHFENLQKVLFQQCFVESGEVRVYDFVSTQLWRMCVCVSAFTILSNNNYTNITGQVKSRNAVNSVCCVCVSVCVCVCVDGWIPKKIRLECALTHRERNKYTDSNTHTRTHTCNQHTGIVFNDGGFEF